MIAPSKLCRLLTLALGIGWLATGCVRLNEPEHFVCDVNGDCESNEKCSESRCVPKDLCVADYDCLSDQRCDNERCVATECSWSTAASKCSGFACVNGACETSCLYNASCATDFHCEGGTCKPGAPLSNGAPCKLDGECASAKCCVLGTGSVCGSSCSTPTPTKAANGSACTSGLNCVSGNCCKGTSGLLTCSLLVCAALAECTLDADCGSNQLCLNQKCVTQPALKLPGEACVGYRECASASCVANVCRGVAKGGDACTSDSSCEADRLCCPDLFSFGSSFCGDLKRGCAGSIGDSCDYDHECFDRCNAGGFCTKTCTSSAECGKSPWGVPNVCATNGIGDKICFPGCTSSQQCYDNLESSLYCSDAFCATE